MLKFFYLILKCELLFPQIKLIVAVDSPRLVKVLRRIIVKQNNLKYISTQIHNSEPEVLRITIKINQKKINYLQRPKVVGHRQDTIVGHNLGNCDRKPGIREKGELRRDIGNVIGWQILVYLSCQKSRNCRFKMSASCYL